MFFIAYTLKGQVHVFACKSLVLQDRCNIEIFLSPVLLQKIKTSESTYLCLAFVCPMPLSLKGPVCDDETNLC